MDLKCPRPLNPPHPPPPQSFSLVAAEASQRTITAQRQTSQVRQETRARLLRAVQQTYEDVFERAQIVPGHMYQLQKSANQALDHTDEALCDWAYLQQNLQLPRWLRVLFRCTLGHAAVSVKGRMALYGSSMSLYSKEDFARDALQGWVKHGGVGCVASHIPL